MRLEVKVSSPLFHTLPVEVAVELCSFFSRFLYVLWNLAGLHLLWVLLLHLLQTWTHTDVKNIEKKPLKLNTDMSRWLITYRVLFSYSLSFSLLQDNWILCVLGGIFLYHQVDHLITPQSCETWKKGAPSYNLLYLSCNETFCVQNDALTQSTLCLSNDILFTQI